MNYIENSKEINYCHENDVAHKNWSNMPRHVLPCSSDILTLLTLHAGLWMLWSTSETGTMMLYPLWPKVWLNIKKYLVKIRSLIRIFSISWTVCTWAGYPSECSSTSTVSTIFRSNNTSEHHCFLNCLYSCCFLWFFSSCIWWCHKSSSPQYHWQYRPSLSGGRCC